MNENTTVTKTLSVLYLYLHLFNVPENILKILGNILDQFLVSAIFSISCFDFIKSEMKQRTINFSIGKWSQHLVPK